MKIAIAVSACCFQRPIGNTGLCGPTVMRLQKTLELASDRRMSTSSFVILLSEIPRGEGNLADLMSRWLMKRKCNKRIVKDGRGLETLSQCRGAIRLAKREGAQKIIWVTSDWYLPYGKPVWEYYASRAKLEIRFVGVQDNAGMKTREDYQKRARFTRLLFTSPWRYFGAPQVLSVLAYLACLGRRRRLTYDGCG